MSSSNRTEPFGAAGDTGSAMAASSVDHAGGPSKRRSGASLSAPPSRPPTSRLAALVFGSDARSAHHIRFGLASSLLHLTWAAIYGYTARHHQMGADAMHLMIATNLVGMFAFYPWVRLGWTRGKRDPALVQPQMLWASLSAVLGFALAPPLRLAVLQMLCLTPMYGFFYLRPRQLMVTGGSSAALLLTALAMGASGYLPRFDVSVEIYPALLTVSVLIGISAITISHSARRGQMQRKKVELDAAVAAVHDLVTRDTLTGLFNRRHLQELLQHEQARASSTGRQFAVALMDLDHFKRINDTHGHATGDEVLRRFADLATFSMRQTDTVARWGGEEFLVLMPATADPQEAREPLDRLRLELERQAAGSLVERLGLTFSAGIAVYRIGDSVEQLVARADRALYAAKAAGRNRLSIDAETPVTAAPA